MSINVFGCEGRESNTTYTSQFTLQKLSPTSAPRTVIILIYSGEHRRLVRITSETVELELEITGQFLVLLAQKTPTGQFLVLLASSLEQVISEKPELEIEGKRQPAIISETLELELVDKCQLYQPAIIFETLELKLEEETPTVHQPASSWYRCPGDKRVQLTWQECGRHILLLFLRTKKLNCQVSKGPSAYEL
ncbi:hypothetical protein J6590_037411 [Homalodisca vitripennis]|nr:hypothetical protein J6590_037411 [Homalodisca vitripennis]